MCRRMIYVVVLMMLGLVPMNPVYGYDPGSPGLLAWWTFDEGTGTVAGDVSGNGNDGTLQDDPTFVDGQFGQALAFEGSRVAIGASDSLTADLFQGSFTLSAWINPTRTGYMWQQIFRSIRTDDTSNDTLFVNKDGRLSWRGRVGGVWAEGMCETAPDVAAANQWTHVAVTSDGTNFRIYVNGDLSRESAFRTTDGENATYYIGGDPRWIGESFVGMIDDVRIYNTALTELEILAAMSGVEKVDMEIGFTTHPPVIDGQVDRIWAAASTQYIDLMVLAPSDGRIDTFVSWKALYDFENLYVIVDISDDILVNDTDSSWQDDSVEFYFDGGNTKDGPPLAGDNRQYTFGWATEDIQGTNIQTEGVEHAQVDTDTGWRIEIKLPWLSLQDTQPQVLDLIGIDCFYNDDDDGGDRCEDQIWTFATDGNAWNDASQWGTAILTAEKRFDVTAPGDLVQGVPNDGDWPTAYYRPETPDLVIDDNIETKYLHFKGDFDPDPGTGGAGFQVTPSAGPTIVTELTFTTANDFPGRDPIAFELFGSNVGIDGPYELIASDYIVDFAQALAWPRWTMNATPISFDNDVPYTHYQLIFTAIRGPAGGSVNSMQIAEVELLGVSAPAVADIILVTEAIDWDLDGLRDDHTLETFLISEGHNVDVRPDYWKVLTPDKIDELNAADLIIFSRLAWSSRYDEGDETTQWNSLTTPLLQMNSHFARNIQWKWVNAGTPAETPYIEAEAVDPYHPIFQGVLTAPEPIDRYDGPMYIVQMIDPLIGTGLTSFIGGTDMGNGRLIAKTIDSEMGWIAEWDVGVEFFEGAGQYAGGKRMLFCAGTQEIQFVDPDTQEVITTAQGELNLTAEGLQMFRNAIAYLLLPEPTRAGTRGIGGWE